MHRLARNHYGGPTTPHEVKHLRISVMEHAMLRGEPVVWHHQFSIDDLEDDYTLELPGVAKQVIPVRKCPACFDSEYGQVRNDCKVCYGVGFTSVEIDPSLWITCDGEIATTDEDDTHVNAPRWRGFGPPMLTWMVEPDTAVDIFKLDRTGALVRTQSAQGLTAWYPEMGDNDLVVNVELAGNGFDIKRTRERYQLKMVNPQTMRGWGSRTRGQEHRVGQTFEMARIPRGSILHSVTVHD